MLQNFPYYAPIMLLYTPKFLLPESKDKPVSLNYFRFTAVGRTKLDH